MTSSSSSSEFASSYVMPSDGDKASEDGDLSKNDDDAEKGSEEEGDSVGDDDDDDDNGGGGGGGGGDGSGGDGSGGDGGDDGGDGDDGDDGITHGAKMAAAAAAIAAIGLGAWAYERRLQKSLTKPPMVFGQINKQSTFGESSGNGSAESNDALASCPRMAKIYHKMRPLLDRPIVPSLVVGTRGMVSSVAAYLQPGPGRRLEEHPDQHHFRQFLTMVADGATVAIDWELPVESHRSEHHNPNLPYDTKQTILNGPISRPVVLIWHGINNDSSFGYVRSLKRSFCDRGWNAAAVNFRGCGGGSVRLTTPRGYNAAYTGDLRNVVWHVAAKMMTGGQRPTKMLFLVGNSLGANLVTKYLGEEGYAGTLPPCVGGGVTLGNPLQISSDNIPFVTGVVMGLGVKRITLQHYKTAFKCMNEPNFQSAFHKAIWRASTVADMDRLVAPVMIRNSMVPPYQPTVGYHGDDRKYNKSQKRTTLSSGELYWRDSSSYPHLKSISIPFLHVIASDDFLVIRPSRNKMAYLLSANPNIMVVETACGGHLGWHEESQGAFWGSSWADGAAADFFAAVMDTNNEEDIGQTEEPAELRSRL